MFFPGQFTLSQSSPPVRNATYLRTFFLRIYLCLSRDFVNQHVFLPLDLHWDSPKLPSLNEFTDLLCWRLSLCLSRDSLSCDTRSLDLCILFKFIFLYLWYIPPHSCAFHTFYFTPIFSSVYYHAKYFSYPWWRCRSELIIIFNFSSQRPHLNYTFIVLLQWNFPRNISANLLIFTNKASSHVVTVSYTHLTLPTKRIV